MQTTTCRAHDRQTGQPCANPAVANTGLCAQHGGPAVEKSVQTNTKHGLFARIVPASLSQVFQDARNNPNPLHLLDEIALVRTFLAHYLANFQDDRPITAEDLERVGRQVDRISRLTVRQSRLLAEAADRVTREELTAWTTGMREVVQQVLREFLPESSYGPAGRRLNALMVERELISAPPEEPDPVADAITPPQPEPVEPASSGPDPVPVASAPSADAPASGPAPSPDVDDDPGPQPHSRLHLPQPDSRLSTLDSRLSSQRPRQCRAYDHNIMRRCEHREVPNTGRCERHQAVPDGKLY